MSLRRGVVCFGAILVCLNGSHALAEGSASFSLNLPVLHYTSTSETVKTDGADDEKSTTSELSTSSLTESYVAIGTGKILVYLFPFYDSKLASVSYVLSDLVEVGFDLGLNQMSRDKPKANATANTFGVYTWLYPKLGGQSTEFALAIDQTTTTGKSTEVTPAGEVTTKTNATDLLVKVVANVVIPLESNLNYAAGVFYSVTTTDDKEAKSKTSASTFGINIASLRVTLN